MCIEVHYTCVCRMCVCEWNPSGECGARKKLGTSVLVLHLLTIKLIWALRGDVSSGNSDSLFESQAVQFPTISLSRYIFLLFARKVPKD